MKLKRHISLITSAAMMLAAAPFSQITAYAEDAETPVYTYEVIPLLEPFNEYFFVKTDNPDPTTFRFFDAETIYAEKSAIVAVDNKYADIEYEDADSLRVNGGYIFKSYSTDGGALTLQTTQECTRREFNELIYGDPDPEFTGYSPTIADPAFYDYDTYKHYKWVDSDVTITLPELVDDCDYLIKTYAKSDDFFENMDNVELGFSSICLYSGSFVRGDVVRKNDYWFVSYSPHADQTFYIQSPYRRQDNKSLFASALYPYRYDSLGFPGMMGSVSKRLSNEATYTWNSYNHYLIDVTYNGEKKSYGGQGNGEGQGVDPDQILKMFSFGDDDKLALEDAKQLLDDYAALDVESDVPDVDTLTWSEVNSFAGDGNWMKIYGGYAFMWNKGDDPESFYADESGVGGSIYWSGSLGYASNVWYDGRYISNHEVYVAGKTFEDYPTAGILLKTILPKITSYKVSWEVNEETNERVPVYYDYVIDEKETYVTFRYNADSGNWRAVGAEYDKIKKAVESGQLDEKYLDLIELTPEEVEALDVDRNTDILPYEGYLFDGSVAPGTPFVNIPKIKGDTNNDGELGIADLVTLHNWLLNTDALEDWENADIVEDEVLDVYDMIALRKLILGISGADEPEPVETTTAAPVETTTKASAETTTTAPAAVTTTTAKPETTTTTVTTTQTTVQSTAPPQKTTTTTVLRY